MIKHRVRLEQEALLAPVPITEKMIYNAPGGIL
jgi:hypothetical protein